MIITFIFLNLIFQLFFFFNIKNFNSLYVLIIYCFQEAIGTFLIIDDYKSWKFYVFIILFCILFFAFLIYNEIIELNFCRLSYNTKKNINLRAKNELMVLEDESNDNKSNKSEDKIEIEGFTFKISDVDNLEKEISFNNSIL